jgi:hypothetical protein
VRTPEEARHAVRDLAARGVDFVKIHNAFPPEAYPALADECRKQHIHFAGHVPGGVTLEDAFAAGQASVEHTTTFFEVALPRGSTKSLAAASSLKGAWSSSDRMKEAGVPTSAAS